MEEPFAGTGLSFISNFFWTRIPFFEVSDAVTAETLTDYRAERVLSLLPFLSQVYIQLPLRDTKKVEL